MTIVTSNNAQTLKFGKNLGAKLKSGDVVALIGELGAGKTVIAKGIAQSLGIKEAVTSPTFTIINEYKGKKKLFHFDLYRLKDVSELENIGYEEYFFDSGITVIEWADRAMKVLPKNSKIVEIEIVGKNRRKITINSEKT